MIITLSGTAGSGKTTFATEFSKRFGWEHFYAGGLRRKLAKEKGMTIEEYNKLGETDPSTDIEVDKEIEVLGKTKDKILIEGRTAYHFVKPSIKIFLAVEPKIGAERILAELNSKDSSRNEAIKKNVSEMISSLKERAESDVKRYKKYYGISNCYEPNSFDIILDTSKMDTNEVFTTLIKKLKEEHNLDL